MNEIIYIPYSRRVLVLLSSITGAGFGIALLILGKVYLAVFVIAVFFLLACYGLTYRGKLKIDKNGIAAIYAKNSDPVLIPWTEFVMCKVYGRDPRMCVCFRNLLFKTGYITLVDYKGGIPTNRWGRKILCDDDLQKLCSKRLSPEAFANKDVLGFTVSMAEYEQIRRWWSLANSASISD